jgi:hypothetical protein
VELIQGSELELRLIGSPFSEGMPQSELIMNGTPTGIIIEGAVLEVAIRWHKLMLLFVTDNITHEETLRIYLFDSRLKIVDSAQLGWIYATGVFTLLELCPPDTVRFRFFGDTDWTLELFDEETFAIPFLKNPRGVSRPLQIHRRFQLNGQPKPETRQRTGEAVTKEPAKPAENCALK